MIGSVAFSCCEVVIKDSSGSIMPASTRLRHWVNNVIQVLIGTRKRFKEVIFSHESSIEVGLTRCNESLRRESRSVNWNPGYSSMSGK